VSKSSNRRGGTKLQNRAVAAVALSSNDNHSSNELGEVIRTLCYCDPAHFAATECSNGRGDDISSLLLWPSSSSHRKIYDINNKVS
jgi:hypothetical protein